ncbi:MAG: hypothetical protein RL060_1648 [Bacteroidota bacterium]|jgi:hypothetical protein
MSDLKDDLEIGDSAQYVSFDAYKTLIDAGLSKAEAMERVGLSAEVIKELEEEEASLEIQDEFVEVWDDGDDFDDEFGGDLDGSADEFDDDEFNSGGGYDDFE